MIYKNDYLQKLIDDHGLIETLSMINVEQIEDQYIKIICRTIKSSSETLLKELETKIRNTSSK